MTAQAIRREIAHSISFSTMRALIALLIMLAVVSLVYLAQSSQATVKGQRAQDLAEQLERLNRENDQLRYDIAVQTAPAKIADRARARGLHPALPTQMVFVVVKNYPVVPTQVVPAATLTTPSSVENDLPVAAIWNDFLAWLETTLSPRPAQASP